MDNHDMEIVQFLEALGKTTVDMGTSKSSEAQKTEQELYFASVNDARMQLDRHSIIGNKQFGLKVAEYITDDSNTVYGNPDQYHNLITSYLREGDYLNALRISEHALKRFPTSVDLLANAIHAASNQGNTEAAKQYIAKAKAVPMKFWTWRLFHFAIEAYKNTMNQCPPDQIDQYHAEAIELAKAYQKTMPMDERGYNQEAELLLMFNDVASARKLLENLLNQGIEVNGIYKHLVASQCCVTMLDRILEDTHEYDEIIRIANRGIQDTAQELPSSHIGYFVYRMALALDAKAVSNQYHPDQVNQALQNYQCAYELNEGRPHYLSTIRTRYTILARHSKDPDIPKTLS